MKVAVFGFVSATILLAGIPVAFGGVNCEQVRRYLKTGRSVEEIAESMIVDVKDVKKCQADDAKAAPAGGAANAPASAAPAAPAADK